MSQAQPLPDTESIYRIIQKSGKKNLNAGKFKLLQISTAAKGIDEATGFVIQAQVHLYFNDFEDAESNLLLAKSKYPNDIRVWNMFLSLYIFWGKWRKLKETITKMYETDVDLSHENQKFFEVLFAYPICFFDLEILELIMKKHHIIDTDNKIEYAKYIIDSIKHLDIEMEAVRDVISFAFSVFYEKFGGRIDVDIFTEDDVTILLFVDVSDVDDLMQLNSDLINKKIFFFKENESYRKYKDYISATFLPSNRQVAS